MSIACTVSGENASRFFSGSTTRFFPCIPVDFSTTTFDVQLHTLRCIHSRHPAFPAT